MIAVVLFGGFFGIGRACADVTPPGQAPDGCGGSAYTHAMIKSHRYDSGDLEYWLFEPADPAPASAPVIIFLHGWGGVSPNVYGAWIEHLVRHGSIVIFPRYQAGLSTSMKSFTPNALAAVKAAFIELKGVGHVAPQLDNIALVGHSMGAAIAPNLAAIASAEKLPIPKAIFSVEPDNKVKGAEQIHMPLEDLGKIAPTTLFLVAVGDADRLAGDSTAHEIFRALGQIPAARKDFVTLVSDNHGSPALVASHFAPLAVKEIVSDSDAAGTTRPPRRRPPFGNPNALNFYGMWKLFDGLTDAAFYGRNIKYALGNTPEQRYMGRWSDGRPVRELKVQSPP